jgi:hypothetical protein
MKGSMLDMAVGIIIGAAFATVISSLVADADWRSAGWTLPTFSRC